VISAEASRSWRWSTAGVVYLGIVGGAAMILIGGISRDSNSVPLLVIGSWWIGMGLVGIWQWRQVAREVRLEGERISFVFPAKTLTMPAADILGIRRARGDVNHWMWLRVQTNGYGTIRVAARLRGLVDVLAALRRLNPRVTYPDF
jgi:hypothetical protein